MNNKQFIDTLNLQTIAEIIGRELGLHYPANRFEELFRGLEKASELFNNNLTAQNLIEEILKAKTIPEHLYTQLSNALTINETYFFRESPAINLFKDVIIKEIENKGGHYKIWSAGCSSGEEPFTLAIIIKEMLPSNITNNVKIIATDLSDKVLKKAKEGVYTQWSFRETPNNIRDKYFNLVDGKWQICEQIKKMVSFSNLNLISGQYPNTSRGINNLNLIFCRNVLMYFSHTNINLVTAKLYNSLCEGGWLVTSQVELNNDLFPNFGKAFIGDGFFYRKEKVTTLPEVFKQKESSLINNDVIRKTSPKKRVRNQNSQPCSNTIEQNRAERVNTSLNQIDRPCLLHTAKEFANKGEYEKALAILEKLTNTEGLELDYFYLYATILSEKRDFERAALFYKKCIYLNPSHILANYMLGNVYVELGKRELSVKYYRAALEQSKKMDPAIEVSDAGGMSAARIAQILENMVKEQQ